MSIHTPSPQSDDDFAALLRESYRPAAADSEAFDRRLRQRIVRSERRRRATAISACVLGAGALITAASLLRGDLERPMLAGPAPLEETAPAAADSVAIDEATAFLLALDTFEEPEQLTTYLGDEYAVLDAVLFGTL